MKTHKQQLTVSEHGHGNCYQATLACLLDVEVYKIPDFALWFDYRIFDSGYHWFNLVNDFLSSRFKVMETHSSQLTEFHNGKQKEFPKEFIGIPYMVSDKSPRGDFNHVVIYMDGKMIHDVHPSNDGIIITNEVDCSILRPIDS